MIGYQIRHMINPYLVRSLIFRNQILGKKGQVPDELLTAVATLHKQGVRGDKDAVLAACEVLEEIRRFYPDNHLIDAYYGSIMALLGRDAVDPIERLEKVRYGLKFLDNAVKNEPDNIDIRIIRGYVCFRLPEVFFHRTQTAVTDFNHIITLYKKNPGLISDNFYRQILHDLAQAYRTLGRDDEANAVQQQPEHPDSGYEGGKDHEFPL